MTPANGQLEIQNALSGNTKLTESVKRTVAVIDAQIKAQKDLQTRQSANSKEYNDYQKKLNALEAERRSIVGASKSEIKSQQTEENKINAILERRKGLLDELAGLHLDATQSRLTKEASEIDKINEKYDETLRKLNDFNKANPDHGIRITALVILILFYPTLRLSHWFK